MMNEKDTAKAIVSLLDESTSRLDQNITSRLAEARQQAVGRMAQQPSFASGKAGLVASFMDYMYHHRAVSSAALAFSALLVAFVTTQQFNHEAEGHGDAFLLASELPPEAFLDKEFHTWLEESSQR
jgi:hypothetical protein